MASVERSSLIIAGVAGKVTKFLQGDSLVDTGEFESDVLAELISAVVPFGKANTTRVLLDPEDNGSGYRLTFYNENTGESWEAGLLNGRIATAWRLAWQQRKEADERTRHGPK